MFGRLNAKLAHLKASSSQRTQTETGTSTAGSTPGTLGSESVATASPVSGAASRAESPISSFHAAKAAAAAAAAAAAVSSSSHSGKEQPGAENTSSGSSKEVVSGAAKSYHLYVETPLENGFVAPHLPPPSSVPVAGISNPLLASPVAAEEQRRLYPATKRRLSSPHLDSSNVVAIDNCGDSRPLVHQAKHTRTAEAPSRDAAEQHRYLGYSRQTHHIQPANIPAYTQSSVPVPSGAATAIEDWGQHPLISGTLSYSSATFSSSSSISSGYYAGGHGVQASVSAHLPQQPLLHMLSQAPPQHQPPPQPQVPHHQFPSQHMGGAAAAPGGLGLAAAAAIAAGLGELPPLPVSDGRTLDDYQLLHTLGTGTFGRVFLCQSRVTKRYFAMKVLRKSQVVKLKQVEHINNEKSILEVARHPFIVQLECTMQNERNLYMLMEYVPGGELFSHLRRAGRFPDDVARFYAAEIVLALDYLHSLKIIWRDTKPENILLDERGHVKLTDFGFAKRVEEGRTWTLCGTPEYLAPEIIQSKGHGKAVDWWALGILIFEMLAGYPPFYDDNPFGIYEKILKGDVVYPGFFSAAARDLIERLLTADVGKRLGNLQGDGEDVKAHAWFGMIDWQVLVQRRIPPPIVPPHRHAGDTCNFDKYPEPPQEPAPEPGVDPYRHLFSTF